MRCETYCAVFLTLVLLIQSSQQAKITGRRKSKEVVDFSSEDVDAVHTHFVHRLTRFFRFGGMINKIAVDTIMDKHEIVSAGRSLYQDRTSGKGREFHAAHVVRAGGINPKIEKFYKDLYGALRNFLGHTDIVPRWNNVWSGVGGDIDRFQESNLRKVIDISYWSSRLSRSDAAAVNSLKSDYIAILNDWINKATDPTNKLNLEIAKEKIEKLSDEDLFQHGKNGFVKQYMEPYHG